MSMYLMRVTKLGPHPASITYVYVIDKGLGGGRGGGGGAVSMFSTYILIFIYKYIIYILKTGPLLSPFFREYIKGKEFVIYILYIENSFHILYTPLSSPSLSSEREG